MYTIEIGNKEITSEAEDYMLEALYEPNTVKLIEEKIKKDEKQLKTITSGIRKLGEQLIKEVKSKKRIDLKDLRVPFHKSRSGQLQFSV
jgi:chromatin segregation and condensation protein Rec8/ScpA/Scc1 (kleisin family)